MIPNRSRVETDEKIQPILATLFCPVVSQNDAIPHDIDSGMVSKTGIQCVSRGMNVTTEGQLGNGSGQGF